MCTTHICVLTGLSFLAKSKTLIYVQFQLESDFKETLVFHFASAAATFLFQCHERMKRAFFASFHSAVISVRDSFFDSSLLSAQT